MIVAALLLAALTPGVDIESRLPAEQRWSADDTAATRISKIVFRYDLCIMQEARRYSRTTAEPAETIADAALGNCSEWAVEFRNGAIALTSALTSTDIDRQLAQYQSTRRQRLVGYVLAQRAGKMQKEK